MAHGLHSYNVDEETALLTLHIQSHILDEQREFYIQLPLSYEEKLNERFPILIALDADLERRPFIRQETSSILNVLLDRHKIPELIVLYIPNKSADTRSRDFTPSQDADGFMDFLELELLPQIEEEYRVDTLRIVHGHSRSALFATHAFLNRPHLFKAIIASSPAYWHDDHAEVGFAREKLQSFEKLENYFYFNIGGEENEIISNSFDRMHYIFRKYAPQGLEWRADFAEFETHGTTRPLGLYLGLRQFFSDWSNRYYAVETWQRFEQLGGLDPFIESFERLSDKYGFVVKPAVLKEIGDYYSSIGEESISRQSYNLHNLYFPQ
ncbi:MAG: hypothetical protein MI746_07970 [Pseudomonadales bacterium]|nr:hypothetical protein [Pseudomonadales bacterium]